MRETVNRDVNKDNIWFDRLMSVVGWVAIAMGIILVILLYKTGRSLWVDEGFLAYSLTNRSLAEMASRILDYNQTAPVLYLYIVKLITMVFGNSELTLRVFSFISYLGMLLCAYYLLKKVFKVSWPILAVGYIATMSRLLYFANEFKPYMNDCFVILFVLVLYDKYQRRELSSLVFAFISMILVWFSSPVLFFLGAIFVYELLKGILSKDLEAISRVVLPGGLVLFSFLVNYWYWLGPVAQSEFMIGYWENSAFPLIINQFEDIKVMVHLLLDFGRPFEYSLALLAFLAALGAIGYSREKHDHTLVILLGVLLTLIASSIGKYPFSYRLVLFLYPILGILTFLGLQFLYDNLAQWRKTAIVLLAGVILLSNYASLHYFNSDERYRLYNEVNPLVDYVDNNIVEGEKLYIYVAAECPFLYRNGYDDEHIGTNVSVSERNVIIGQEWNLLRKPGKMEVSALQSEEQLYILLSSNSIKSREYLLQEMRKTGDLELILDEHQTSLYYWNRDTEDEKN